MILTADKSTIYEAADRLEALAKALRERAEQARYPIVHLEGTLSREHSAKLPSDEQRRQIFAALGLYRVPRDHGSEH